MPNDITTISLEKMFFKAYHGYYEDERKMGNEFYLDVSISLAKEQKYDDDIDKTINYEDVYTICKEEMESTKWLLETVANHILGRIKTKWPQALHASVCLSKVGPQLGGRIDFAKVKMEF